MPTETIYDMHLSPQALIMHQDAVAAWCELTQADPATMTPPQAATYLASRLTAGLDAGLLIAELEALAMSKICRTAGRPDPIYSEEVISLMARASHLMESGKAAPLTIRCVNTAHLAVQRATTTESRLKALEALTAVLLLRETLVNKNELSMLTWQEIITTDQPPDNDHRYHPIQYPLSTMLRGAALEASDGREDERVFPCKPATVPSRLKRLCRDAGLGTGYGMQSGSIGMMFDLMASGTTLPKHDASDCKEQGRLDFQKIREMFQHLQDKLEEVPLPSV